MDHQRIFLVLIVAAAVLVICLVALAVTRKRRRERLKRRFGAEYDRVVQTPEQTENGEIVLAKREKRVDGFALRPLAAGDREAYVLAWASAQSGFVDDPSFAVAEGDKLVETVLAARGYPMASFEQRAADISVNYPGVVQNYRSAREIALRRDGGQVTTEELRQAMIFFRSLFDELLEMRRTDAAEMSHERAS